MGIGLEGFLVVLEVSGPEAERQHTLLWVHILTSGESHPLPAEHWPTDGTVGANRQRKQKHVEKYNVGKVDLMN